MKLPQNVWRGGGRNERDTAEGDVMNNDELDDFTDLLDDINSDGRFSVAEITRCEKCGEWKLPRYDQATRKMTRKHICKI